ncbi:MAG TPA: DUF559 domain-containing protein [Pseudonocardiaceae bacterium]|nr:DUF559 domain-containing protein [Pseudonocardiaceae bacterium]
MDTLALSALGYLIDLVFPALRVAIEVDGWAGHVTADRFVQDRRRQNAVVNLQWTVLRFTWHDLVGRPDGVLDEIRFALSQHPERAESGLAAASNRSRASLPPWDLRQGCRCGSTCWLV